jgi:hypothetical protein
MPVPAPVQTYSIQVCLRGFKLRRPRQRGLLLALRAIRALSITHILIKRTATSI